MSLSFCNQQLEAKRSAFKKLPIDKKPSEFALPTIAKLPVPSDNLILGSPLNANFKTRRRQGMPCLYELAVNDDLFPTENGCFAVSFYKQISLWGGKTRGTCPSRTLPFAGYSRKATDIFN